MGTERSQEQIETEFGVWLMEGGAETIRTAMKRAKATSEQFERSTRIRAETLREPFC